MPLFQSSISLVVPFLSFFPLSSRLIDCDCLGLHPFSLRPRNLKIIDAAVSSAQVGLLPSCPTLDNAVAHVHRLSRRETVLALAPLKETATVSMFVRTQTAERALIIRLPDPPACALLTASSLKLTPCPSPDSSPSPWPSPVSRSFQLSLPSPTMTAIFDRLVPRSLYRTLSSPAPSQAEPTMSKRMSNRLSLNRTSNPSGMSGGGGNGFLGSWAQRGFFGAGEYDCRRASYWLPRRERYEWARHGGRERSSSPEGGGRRRGHPASAQTDSLLLLPRWSSSV